MNKNHRISILAVIVLLLITSCSGSPDAILELPKTKNTSTIAPTSTSVPTPTKVSTLSLPTSESIEKESFCLPRYSKMDEFLHLSAPADLWWVDSADFNGDEFPDIVLSRGVFQSGEAFELGFLLNDGKGNLAVGTSDIFNGEIPKVVEPREVVLADFNGDDRTDIFIADQGMDANPWPGHQNTLVLSVPGGKMVDATINLPKQSDQTHSATAADIDGDGDNDLYVGNLGGGGVQPQIWLNDGTGIFTIASNILPPEQTNLSLNWYTTSEFADINDDTFPDLILGQGDPNRNSHVLLNDGTGNFARVEKPLPPSFFAPEQQIVDIKAGDITGDGYLDLLLVDTRNSYFGWYIQVLINNGDGTFRDETSLRLDQSGANAPWMWRVNLIDLNMDGFLDIAASPTQGSGGPLFYLNDGEGIFQKQPNIFKIEHSYLWTFLDIDQDGLQDVFWSYPRCNDSGSCPEIHFMVNALGCP